MSASPEADRRATATAALLAPVLDGLRQSLGAAACLALALDAAGSNLSVLAVSGAGGEPPAGLGPGRGLALEEAGALAAPLREGRPLAAAVAGLDLPPAVAALAARVGATRVEAAPLTDGGQPLGVVVALGAGGEDAAGAGGEGGCDGDREARPPLSRLAPAVTAALRAARLAGAAGERARRLAAVLRAGAALAASDDLGRLLQDIAASGRELLDSDECAIDIYEPGTEEIVVAALAQRRADGDWRDWVGRRYRLDDFPADREVLLSGEVREERLGDPGLDPRNRAEMERNGEKTVLTVPLVRQGEPVGLLAFIELSRERRFTPEEVELAVALASQAAALIHRARLLDRLARQNRRLEALLASTRAITSSVDLEQVLDTVARTAAELLEADGCQIQEYDREANTVRPVAIWERQPAPGGKDSLGKVFSLDDDPQEREFLESMRVLEQHRTDPDLAPSTRAAFERYGDQAYLNVPLVFNGAPVGLLVLIQTRHDRRWEEDEVALARGFAEQAAVAIEHARLYRQAREQAVRDGLTGLYNHRHFYERLEQEVARARRYGTPVSLLMIDLDDFKAFNDRHGHLAGDAVLRGVAAVLQGELRQHLDVAARYGGEEFAVILPNTPRHGSGTQGGAGRDAGGGAQGAPPPGDLAPPPGDAAERVAERIRRRVAAASFCDPGGRPLGPVTVSIGVAVYPEGTRRPEDLVAHADAALYLAKRAGKDRVVTYG